MTLPTCKLVAPLSISPCVSFSTPLGSWVPRPQWALGHTTLHHCQRLTWSTPIPTAVRTEMGICKICEDQETPCGRETMEEWCYSNRHQEKGQKNTLSQNTFAPRRLQRTPATLHMS